MSKDNNGLLDLSFLESAGQDDVLDLPLNESNNEVSVPVPGGLNEKAPGQPADQTIPVPSKTTIDAASYNEALKNLQKSFAEAAEFMGILANATIVEESVDELQDTFTENAMDVAFLESLENGPFYEKVDRSDKDEVKAIVRDVRPKIKDSAAGKNGKYQPTSGYIRHLGKILELGVGLMVTEVGVGAVTSVATGALVAKILKEPVTGNLVKQLAINGAKIGGAVGGVATGVNTVANVIASFVMRIKTHAWQIVGTIYVPEKKMTSIVNGLNDEFKDALGDYKFVAVPTCKVITDGFRAHYKWSETGTVYFIIIDKEIPEDLKVLKSDIKVDSKTLKEIKSGKKSKKDGESVNESTETKDENPDDEDEEDETKNED